MARVVTGNEQFARYVTSTAFSISLSGSMVAALDHLMTCRGRWISNTPLHWVVGVNALVRRGLAERDPDDRHVRVTAPGEVVHQLCVMAGLVQSLDQGQVAS